ncbi:hypothetical protein E3P99_03970 [Wallemia hederae]|uniref:SGF29 C-terminal domain-containing protein n=1 Tax=Wallemia hederae TaxID=1540922 RepID=A0A4T0FFP2_9BASI|nr:hypothetical protein E3P99_03970 [Wallemia hederae]
MASSEVNDKIAEINDTKLKINELVNYFNKFYQLISLNNNFSLEKFKKIKLNYQLKSNQLKVLLEKETELVNALLPVLDNYKTNYLEPDHPVAFKLPKNDQSVEDQWILAKIIHLINNDSSTYKVQDVEPSEDGGPGQIWETHIDSIIALPKHSESQHKANTLVLGLYPDTTSFYRATVIQPPSGNDNRAAYLLRFEDDDAPFQTVSSEHVISLPNGIH